MKKQNEKMDKQSDEIKEIREIIKKKDDEINKLKSENNKYVQNNSNITTQNNINKQLNQQNFINLLAFGKEDMTHLTDEIYKKNIEFVTTNERSFI